MKRIQNYDRDGFTLVELLTVVGIIVLLVAILVPAVNSVRNQAKNTTTKASIGTISTGLETFRADQTVGGLYPPSASDELTSSGERTYEVVDPSGGSIAQGGGTSKRDIRMTGAGLLVWALAGADLLGTPGFKSVNGNTQWSDDTHTKNDSRNPGIYQLRPNTGEPVFPRSGPFVDLNTVRVTRKGTARGGSKNRLSYYPIPAEETVLGAHGKTASKVPERSHPVFLDAFDGPILYWRSDPAGVLMADITPKSDRPRERGIFHFDDNSAFLVGKDGVDPIWLNVNREQDKPHELDLREDGDDIPLDPVELREATGPKAKKLSFARAIQDINISAKSAPQNAKSFLLWSPGRDGVFGNADDVTNFKPFGGE